MKTLIASLLALLTASAGAKTPDWALGRSIYEVNPEMFAAKGAFQAIQADLPRIKKLGAGILWLMPLHPRGEKNAYKSPYCIRDYRGLYAPYGNAEDFRALVKAAHEQDLKVILDWVGNHTSWDHPWINEHPEFYAKDEAGKIHAVKNYLDIVQLDLKHPGLRKEMIEAMAYWVKEFDIDGYRCDYAWNVPVDFWVEARQALEALKPVYMLAEANDPAYQAAFDSDYDWTLMPLNKNSELIQIGKGLKPASWIDGALEKEAAYKAPFTRLRFISNHDQFNDVGTPGQNFGAQAPAFATLMTTLPGKPLIYNGQELGWEGRYNGPRTAWNTPPSPRLDFKANSTSAWWSNQTRRLLSLHRLFPAAHSGDYTKLGTNEDCRVFAFMRQSGQDKLLVLLNLSSEPASYLFERDAIEGEYLDLASGAPTKLSAVWEGLLAPGEHHVYVSGPSAAILMASLQDEPALAPSWKPLALDAFSEPCPAIEVYPTPDPVLPRAKASCAPGEWTSVTRLVSGSNRDRVSARFNATWTKEKLKLVVEVTDPSLRANPGDPWENDAIELYLDGKNCRQGAYQADDIQYIFSWGRTAPFQGAGKVQGVSYTAVATKDGWRMEAQVPWSAIGLKPKAGAVIGLEVGVDFNQDGSGRQGQLMWHGMGDSYQTTKQFGELELVGCAK